MAMRLLAACDLRCRRNCRRWTRTHRRNKPRPGAGGRAWPGPQLAERIKHRPLSLCMWERCWRRHIFVPPTVIGPIPLSRSDPLPGICSMTPKICSCEPSALAVRPAAIVNATSGFGGLRTWPTTRHGSYLTRMIPLLPSATQSSCVAVFLFDQLVRALSRIDVGPSRPSALAVVSYFTDQADRPASRS
jgi:hypothetical protein